LAQTTESDRPVPILTGTAGYFNFVTAGQNQLDAQINPVVLLPLGDRWLIESRAEFEGAFERPPDGGSYGGMVSKNLDYAQVDYIANRFVTVTLGRFLTPFGIFNERLYPIWIRSLQQDPLILPLSAESNDGMMLRGGFPAYCRRAFAGSSALNADTTLGGSTSPTGLTREALGSSCANVEPLELVTQNLPGHMVTMYEKAVA
jgi:hypothetical protein